MKDIEVAELENKTVGIILSSRYARYFFGNEKQEGPVDQPIAVKLAFGWFIAGPSADGFELEARIDEIPVEKLLHFIYRHDFIARPHEDFPPEMQHMSQYDRFALQQMKESIRYDKEACRYEVAIPWKHGREATAAIFKDVRFYEYAKRRTDKLGEKMLRDPATLHQAFQQMEESVALGHARILNDHSAPANSPVCYLAHHFVRRDDKPGKLRITQDAAAKVQGHALNSHLLSGPDLLNKLIGILLGSDDMICRNCFIIGSYP